MWREMINLILDRFDIEVFISYLSEKILGVI